MRRSDRKTRRTDEEGLVLFGAQKETIRPSTGGFASPFYEARADMDLWPRSECGVNGGIGSWHMVTTAERYLLGCLLYCRPLILLLYTIIPRSTAWQSPQGPS